MATTQSGFGDPQPSPGLSINLSSNNPFRNRAGSPLPKSPASPFDDPTPQSQEQSRPVSKNPFLDFSDSNKTASQTSKEPAPLITMADEKATKPSATEDLFAGLSLLDKKSEPSGASKPSMPPNRPPRGENMPPPGRRGPPPPGHRSSDRPPKGPGGPSSPQRRASSSGVDKHPRSSDKRPLTEEEKKKRAEIRKKRDAKGKKGRHFDQIDLLDETNPLGGRVHHGGPYDAALASLNKTKNAPLKAFPEGSANMVLGGSGPINSRADHSTFMGTANDEAFADYGISLAPPTKKDVLMFNPHDRASMVHGDETVGLGTSTFLEGTPAAKSAVEKAEQETAVQQEAGLQRKKSLAQRFRSINRPSRDGYGPSGRMTNPEGVYRDRPSAGSVSSPRGETNPFFNEYEPSKDGEERISVRKMSSGGPTSPALPGNLERRSTADGLGGFEQPKQKTGLLGRMKSLKGGPRQPRPLDGDNA